MDWPAIFHGSKNENIRLCIIRKYSAIINQAACSTVDLNLQNVFLKIYFFKIIDFSSSVAVDSASSIDVSLPRNLL